METQLASLMAGQWVIVLEVVLPALWEGVKDKQLAYLELGKWVALMGLACQCMNWDYKDKDQEIRMQLSRMHQPHYNLRHFATMRS